MDTSSLLRMIDAIHRDKDIPKEVLFRGLEEALAQGIRKRLGVGEDLVVAIDRQTGEVTMEDDEEEYEFDLAVLGRIVAQAVKQGFNQKVREAERDVLYEEYESRVGQILNGVVQRFEELLTCGVTDGATCDSGTSCQSGVCSSASFCVNSFRKVDVS